MPDGSGLCGTYSSGGVCVCVRVHVGIERKKKGFIHRGMQYISCKKRVSGLTFCLFLINNVNMIYIKTVETAS